MARPDNITDGPDPGSRTTDPDSDLANVMLRGDGEALNFKMLRCLPILLLVTAGCSAHTDRSLPIGSSAPDFSLAGVDGKQHSLSEYASSRVLAIVFTCNHCPAAQRYEERLKKIDQDYRSKGVTLVAINADNPGMRTQSSMTSRCAKYGPPTITGMPSLWLAAHSCAQTSW